LKGLLWTYAVIPAALWIEPAVSDRLQRRVEAGHEGSFDRTLTRIPASAAPRGTAVRFTIANAVSMSNPTLD
jgi:hypothetical protein